MAEAGRLKQSETIDAEGGKGAFWGAEKAGNARLPLRLAQESTPNQAPDKRGSGEGSWYPTHSPGKRRMDGARRGRWESERFIAATTCQRESNESR
jgi:hypothetical protein